MYYICEYGIHHGQREVVVKNELTKEFKDCDCYSKYGSAYRMIVWLKEKGYTIEYPHDITTAMREEYLAFKPRFPKPDKKQWDPVLLKAMRIQWTNDKLKTMTADEVTQLKSEAENQLKHAIQEHRVSKLFIREYTMCLLRLRYWCPY